MDDTYNLLSAVFYFINNMLGSGINFMPAAFNNSGFPIGFCILSFVTFFSGMTIYYLLRCATKYENDDEEKLLNYANIAKNKKNRFDYLVNASMISTSFLSSIGLHKYFKELLFLIISGFFNDKTHFLYKYLDISILILSAIILASIGMVKDLGRLKILSKASVFCVCSLIFVLLLLNISLPDFIANNPKIENKKMDWIYSFSWFVMSMCIHLNVPQIFPNLIDKSKKSIIKMSFFGAISGFVIYGTAGVLGYRLIGDCIGKDDLMTIFLKNDSLLNGYLVSNNTLNSFYSKFLRCLTFYQGVCAATIIMVGYPMRLSPILNYAKEIVPFEDKNSFYAHNIILFPLMAVISCINAIPNISLNFVYGLLGPSFVNFLSFLFPSVLYFLYGEKKSLWSKVLSFALMLASILYFGFGITNTILNYGTEYEGKNEICSANFTTIN